ncbi:MAG: hypothetical protein HC895_25050 [Leptolyngbyaceae cyanobacterium SM1_3_5]|nr:hypothetical protein [Leptolyngbyaceae cyanobacterium SM1_3_5]
MSQSSAMPEFEPSANVIELPLERVREVAPEAVAPLSEVRSKSAKELADEYGVSDRTINTWFKTVAAAYCWMEVEALKTGKSAKTRYTPLFQTLLADYRSDAANRSDQDWVAAVHAAHADQLPTAAAALEAPAIEPETVAEPEPEPSNAIVVPKSHIQLLDDHQQSELTLIHSLYVQPEPTKTFQSIELNGDQETILEGLKLLHSTVSQMKRENNRIKSDTTQRKSDIELANEVLAAITQAGKKAVEENFERVAEAQAVKAEETEAKKRLAQLLKSLGAL